MSTPASGSAPVHPFLDSELSADERAETARFHVIPCGLEKTVSYGSGAHAGPAAILAASDQLERLWDDVDAAEQGIHTQSAVDCDRSIEAVLEELADRAEAVARAGGIPVTLGGEHGLSYGPVLGVRRAVPDVGIVQIDAHADMRNAYQGLRHSHASVMHLLAVEERIALAQFGVRAICAEERDLRRENDVFHVDARSLARDPQQTIALPDDFPPNVYVSFDVDGLDPSIMPATGTPVPGGLGFYQSLDIVEAALVGRRCVGIDLVEFAPIDGAHAWDFTAAQIVYALMCIALNNSTDQ